MNSTERFFDIWKDNVLGNKDDLAIGLSQLEEEIRADARKKVLDDVDVVLEGIVSGIECAMRVNPNLSVRDVVTSFVYTLKNVLQDYEQKGEQK